MQENAKTEVAARLRWYKALNWNVHVEKAQEHFMSVIQQARAESFFEDLYLMRDDGKRQIQLFAGAHPIGSGEVLNNASGGEHGYRIYSEHGAALVISQSATGEVAVLLYPYSSERHRRIQPNIVWTILSDPKHLTQSLLKAATRDFFIYVRVSSALFSESMLDRLRILYLELRATKFSESGSSFAKVVFSHWSWAILSAVGSIASIWPFLK